MRNEVIFDNRGILDIMVVFTPDKLGLSAEIRGKVVKEYAISKYSNRTFRGQTKKQPQSDQERRCTPWHGSKCTNN